MIQDFPLEQEKSIPNPLTITLKCTPSETRQRPRIVSAQMFLIHQALKMGPGSSLVRYILHLRI